MTEPSASEQHYNWCFDVSHSNGTIDWVKVAAGGYHLAIVKASQGAGFKDPQFDANRRGADTHAIMLVPYHFLSSTAAKGQVGNFVRCADVRPGRAVMLDWESDVPSSLPPVEVVEEVVDRVRQVTGRDPLMYHGIYTLQSKKINACPWALPKYGPEPTKWRWLFWQNSARSKVPGIQGYVDHDFFHGTEAQLRAWYDKGTMPSNLTGV